MNEALKLALDALQKTQLEGYNLPGTAIREAITAIKAALAQPTSGDYALGYTEGFNDACKPKPAQPAQEPVAWGNMANWCLDSDRVLITDKTKAEKYHRDAYDLTPLYTTPQQRPWVGLTEAQFLEAVRLAENRNYLVAIQRIQEWLKEGNA